MTYGGLTSAIRDRDWRPATATAIRDRDPRPRPRPQFAISLCKTGTLFVALVLCGFAPLLRADSLLVPAEDDRWDDKLRRGIQALKAGDLREGIKAIEGVIEDAESRRSLHRIPARAAVGGLAEWLLQVRENTAQAAPRPVVSPQRFRPGQFRVVPGGIAPLRPNDGRPDEGADLAPEPASPSREVELYVPVAQVALSLLDGLSPEGVAIYRELYGEVARSRLERWLSRGDREGLERAAEDYPHTQAGFEAAVRLGDLLLEEGQIVRAANLWESVLPRAGDDVRLRLKILAALRLGGSLERSDAARRTILARLRELPLGAEGLQKFHESLELLEESTPLRVQDAPIAVTVDRSQHPAPPLVARRYLYEWDSPHWSRAGINRRYGPTSPLGGGGVNVFGPPVLRGAVPALIFFPAYSAGTGTSSGDEAGSLFLNGVHSFHRIGLGTGKLEADDYPLMLPERPELYRRGDRLGDYREGSESPVYTAAVAPAALPSGESIVVTSFISHRVAHTEYLGYEITSDLPTRSLVAFEEQSRRVVWRATNLQIDGQSKPVSFTSPVLIADGKVCAFGWKQHGYLDGVLVALDLATGREQWHRSVISSQMETTMFGELGREPYAAALSEHEGTLYVATQLGAVAAVEADTGRILWLTTYDALDVQTTMGTASIHRDVYWGVNPPLLVGETLIVTPRDSEWLYALHAGSSTSARSGGEILWRHSNSNRALKDLLGYSPKTGYLYFSGPGGVQALDLRRGGDGPPQLVQSPLRRLSFGRAALTDSGVVAAHAAPVAAALGKPIFGLGLQLVDLELKSLEELAPTKSGVKGELQGANVAVFGDRILLTTRDSVSALVARRESPDGGLSVPPGAASAKPATGDGSMP